jgi:hypothetical protein
MLKLLGKMSRRWRHSDGKSTGDGGKEEEEETDDLGCGKCLRKRTGFL